MRFALALVALVVAAGIIGAQCPGGVCSVNSGGFSSFSGGGFSAPARSYAQPSYAPVYHQPAYQPVYHQPVHQPVYQPVAAPARSYAPSFYLPSPRFGGFLPRPLFRGGFASGRCAGGSCR